MAATYSPALHCSTIGASGLNFSVRNGKRWSPTAITTVIVSSCVPFPYYRTGRITDITEEARPYTQLKARNITIHQKAFGQLVQLGFDVAVFTPAPYRRPRLGRPSKRSSHLAAGFALRCVQRLSVPDSDTRRCTWRHNRQTGGLSVTVLSY